jgi:peptide deformylase
MAIREIVTVPADVLRQKAKKVPRMTPELQVLIDDMIETMRQAPGVGLAAPQVDVPLRIIVVEYGEPPEDPEAEPPALRTPGKPKKLYAVVNPEIARHNSETVAGTEGCLSIPDYMGDVDRYSQVTVKGLDRHGKPFKLKAKGWLARVFQHEIDHVNGVLFIDRATKLYKVEPEDQAEADATV